ncbi:MAG: sulfatase [Candidatus Hydrogenedentes bacterium]|nr:sulfatase [Candidatus Hydrogenedentota bacterium]
MKKTVVLVAGAVMLCAASFILGRFLSSAPAEAPAALPVLAAPAPPSPPNVVWLVLDACRSDHLSCYGYPVETSPSMDRIARAGVVFENNYAQGLMTTISVPSYLTGQLLPTMCTTDVNGRIVPRVRPADEKYVSEILRENGYTTLFAASHPIMTQNSPMYQSFDKAAFVPSRDRFPAPPLSEMLPAVKDLLTTGVRPGAPYFLHIHCMETHFPHRGEGKWSADTYVSDDIRDGMPVGLLGCSFDEEERECMRNLHDASIRSADRAFGELVAFLESRGDAENTIFVITADHGELLGEDGTRWGHAAHIADPVLRAPLILSGPGLPAGMRVPGLTRNMDILPTLLDLLGLRTDATMHGVSLMPLVRGEKGETGEPVLARANGYEKDVVFVLVNREHRYEYALDTGQERVFPAPDAERRELEGVPPEVVGGYRETITGTLLPLWERYLSHPRTFQLHDFQKAFDPDSVSPRDALLVREGDAGDPADLTDNRWSLSKGVLWSANPTEEAPPLTMTFPLESGKYSAWVILSAPEKDKAPSPVSVTVQLPGAAPVEAHWEPLPREPLLDHYFPVGEVAVGDAGCSVVLSPGGKDRWSAVGGVKFFRVDGGVLKDGASLSMEEFQENMQALGYLN